MAREPERPASEDEAGASDGTGGPRCSVCDVKLSVYNPGPNCWQHTMGWPWRGPHAKPKL